MAEYTYEGAQDAPRQSIDLASATNWAGAAVSLALLIGVGIWGYKLIARDVSGVPVVQAMAGPMRVAPENPGGVLADHQGLAVNAVAGQGAAEPPADRLMLAPRPAGLSEDDIALGQLQPQQRPETPMRTSLAQEAEVVDLAPPADLAEDDGAGLGRETDAEDPIQALADQLAAGATSLSPLAESDTPTEAEAAWTALTEQAAAPKPGPGLARSLRPQVRPGSFRTASLAPVAPSAPAPAAEQAVKEVDPASLPAGTRLVQIGAFDSAETARAEWARLRTRFDDYLSDRSRVIQKASSGGRVFYRLRAAGFEDLADARRFCAAFVAENVDCIPVVTR